MISCEIMKRLAYPYLKLKYRSEAVQGIVPTCIVKVERIFLVIRGGASGWSQGYSFRKMTLYEKAKFKLATNSEGSVLHFSTGIYSHNPPIAPSLLAISSHSNEKFI